MQSLPLFHRIAGQPVLVVGHGEAADAKARLIAEAGGRVVQAVEPGVRLAFVALDTGAEAEAARLRALGLLVNVVDRPALCDFTVPAIVDRSPVLVAVGTGGASASLSKALKERLEILFPAGLGRLATVIAASRERVSAVHDTVSRRRVFWAGVLAPGSALDPLVEHSDPQVHPETVLAASADVVHILIGPDGADGLTLRQLRQMAQADLVVHDAEVGADVLALVRRDASRLLGGAVPDNAVGRAVLITTNTEKLEQKHA